MKTYRLLLITLLAGFYLTMGQGATLAPLTVGVVDAAELQNTMRKIWSKQNRDDKALTDEKNALKRLRDTITEKRAQYKDDNPKLSAKQKQALQAEVDTLQQTLVKKTGEFRKTMLASRQAQSKQLQATLKSEIASLAKKHKVSLVLSSQQVLFAETQVDLTKELIAALAKYR